MASAAQADAEDQDEHKHGERRENGTSHPEHAGTRVVEGVDERHLVQGVAQAAERERGERSVARHGGDFLADRVGGLAGVAPAEGGADAPGHVGGFEVAELDEVGAFADAGEGLHDSLAAGDQARVGLAPADGGDDVGGREACGDDGGGEVARGEAAVEGDVL